MSRGANGKYYKNELKNINAALFAMAVYAIT